MRLRHMMPVPKSAKDGDAGAVSVPSLNTLGCSGASFWTCAGVGSS